MRVFLDASVLISAMISPKGGSAEILHLIQNQKIEGFISAIIIQEVLRNLKTKFSEVKMLEFVQYLPDSKLKKVEFAGEEEFQTFRSLTHSKDLHVLAGAAKAKASHLITLDKKHLLQLNQDNLAFQIIAPGEYLREFLKQKEKK